MTFGTATPALCAVKMREGATVTGSSIYAQQIHLALQTLADLSTAEQEFRLIKTLAPHPRRDLAIVLARVATPAGGHDVVKGVAPSTRQRQYAIALHSLVWLLSAIGATTP